MNPAEQVLQYHIQLGRDVPVGKYCLLPGDPGRCAAIAAHFDDPVHQMTNREYCTWTGTLLGQPVSVVLHRHRRPLRRHRHRGADPAGGDHLPAGGHLRRHPHRRPVR